MFPKSLYGPSPLLRGEGAECRMWLQAVVIILQGEFISQLKQLLKS